MLLVHTTFQPIVHDIEGLCCRLQWSMGWKVMSIWETSNIEVRSNSCPSYLGGLETIFWKSNFIFKETWFFNNVKIVTFLKKSLLNVVCYIFSSLICLFCLFFILQNHIVSIEATEVGQLCGEIDAKEGGKKLEYTVPCYFNAWMRILWTHMIVHWTVIHTTSMHGIIAINNVVKHWLGRFEGLPMCYCKVLKND